MDGRTMALLKAGVPPKNQRDIPLYYALMAKMGSNIPNGYTKLAYIEGAGTQYIDTGLVLSDSSKVEFRFRLPEVQDGSRYLFGAQATTSTGRFGLAKSSAGPFTGMYNTSGAIGTGDGAVAADTEWHTIVMDGVGKRYAIDGVEVGIQPGNADFTTVKTALIFSTAGANGGAKVDGAYCKIWENGVLAGHFVAAVRTSDGAAGMYDLVSGSFLTNAGTGEFVLGYEE